MGLLFLVISSITKKGLRFLYLLSKREPVPGLERMLCYHNQTRQFLHKGKMMAITIRDTTEHEKMLSDLKDQTNTSTMSKALIKGGYDALRYKELYLAECHKNKQLRDKLYDNNQAVSDFLDALDGLKQISS